MDIAYYWGGKSVKAMAKKSSPSALAATAAKAREKNRIFLL
jgi:hypothetical protein